MSIPLSVHQCHGSDSIHCRRASAFLIDLGQPLDKPAFENFLMESTNDGMGGVIVAPLQKMERLAIAISYGPLTIGRTLVMAANQVLPPHATVTCIKPGGEFDGWNGMVRDFEALNATWVVKAAPTTWNRPTTVRTHTSTNLKVRIHQQRDHSVE